MSTQNPKTHSRISLKLAKIRVKAWLDTMSKIPYFKDRQDQIPRALYIPFEDIEQLQIDCKKYYGEDKIKGFRVYFGLAGENESKESSIEDFRGLIVPVLEVHPSRHKDAIYQSLDERDPEKTSIYDFTAPCPKYCDNNSELYLKVE